MRSEGLESTLKLLHSGAEKQKTSRVEKLKEELLLVKEVRIFNVLDAQKTHEGAYGAPTLVQSDGGTHRKRQKVCRVLQEEH